MGEHGFVACAVYEENSAMPKVKNPNMAGQLVHVIDTLVQFDAEGVATVSAEQAAHLAQIPFYEALGDEGQKLVAESVEDKPAPKKSKKAAAAEAETPVQE